MTYGTNGRERSRVGAVTHRFWAWAVLLSLVMIADPVAAQNPVQIYYLPLPEEEILTTFLTLDTSATPLSGDNSIRTIVGITVTQTGTTLFYDQWENDFDPQIDDPDDLYSAGNPGGTQIWGDGNPANGAPPGYPSDLITAGDVIVLDNSVPASPRDPANILFDGGDKIATTWPIAVTRAAWPVPTTGTVIGGAIEVFPTRDWGTTYEAPGGEDLATSCTTTNNLDDTADYCMFQDSRLFIMAREDGTQVAVDVDGDGADDIIQSLEEGESLTVDGAQAGSKVTAAAPVQVNELTGDVGARFEARWFALVPLSEWSDTYVAPVGTTVNPATADDNTAVVVYNPGPSAITVSVDQLAGCSEVVLAAGETGKAIIGWNGDPATNPISGARLSSAGALSTPGFDCTGDAATGGAFFALAAIDDEAITHDWGHTLLPETTLSIDLKVGWAPGSNDDPENSSPLWIASLAATNVCVDFDDDGTPDLVDTDGDGVGDTLTLDCPALATMRIFEPNPANGGDSDQTGTRVFSTSHATCSASSPKDGALLAGAWGQDPATASAGNPALDLGTTVLQVPPIILAKEGALAVDVNGNGLVDPGDSLGYSISVLNSGTATAVDVTLSDTLDPNTIYVLNTTTRDDVPVPDNGAPATPFPLDETGLSLGNLGPGVRAEIEFLVQVDPDLPAGTDAIVNRATVTTGTGETSDDSASAPVFDGNPRVNKVSSVSGSVLPGDVITYSIAPRNTSDELQTNVQLVDTIPTGTTFVGGSASPPQDSGPDPLVWNLGSNVAGVPGSVPGEVTNTVRDEFTNIAYNGSNGSVDWSPSPWQELGDGGSASSGRVRVDFNDSRCVGSSNCLRIGADDESISGRGALRPADLGGASSATLTFYMGRSGETGGTVRLAASGDGGTNWTTLQTYTVGGSQSPTLQTFALIPHLISSNTQIRFLGSGSTGEPGYIYFDDVQIEYITSPGASTTTTMTAEGSLVTDGDTITVTMELTSDEADTNVTPGALNVVGTNGAGAACGSPSPASQSIAADTPITFVWTCTANAGATPGSVTFTAAATGDSSSFAAATSNSVLVSPLLTFQVTVDDPLDINITNILNTAELSSDQQPDPNKDTVVDPVDTGASIGNSVWLDVDGDGIQDVGEDGLANVLVELRDGVCTPAVDCPTTVTDAAGNYLFAYLTPGTYTVAVLSGVPSGLVESPGNSSGVSDPITVSGSQQFLDADFGYTAQGGIGGTGVVGNFVWSDADGDGLQDPGEPGIGGVTLDLMGPGPDGVLGTADDVVVASTTTAADGSYLFTGLAGQYQVKITDTAMVLSGYAATAGPQSEGGYVSAPVTVASGIVSSEVDFGFDNDALFSISDAVWTDSDGDGVRDPSEVGIAGVTVDLLDAFGNIIATTITDASGDFSFDGLIDNSKYTIEIADVTGQLTGLGGTTVPARTRQLGVSMSGADVSGTNFGYNAPASLRGVIWNDADGDGVQDPEEIGLGGVTVELQDGCTAGVDCPITVTAADGSYSFVGLRPDLYTVEVTDTAGALTGYTQTGDPDEAGTCSVCDSLSTTVVSLTTGDQSLDFGYRNGSLDDISGRIFDDEDADGVEDPGESGLAGVTVELLDGAGNVLATTTTDSNGDYVFPDLPSSSYSVRVTDEAGFLDGYSLTSGLDELSAQPGDSDVEFGYTRRPGTAAIGDRLWLDADGDGQAGPNEAGLAGVTVELWEDTDGDGVLNPANDTLIGSTVTDANGDYVFDALSAGSYFVDVDETTLPVTASGDLVETTYPSGVNPSAVIALSATERFGGADFGYLPASGTAVLGDRVWYDADGNGLQDPGELGIGGVDVTVFGPGCSPCTVTTDPDGSWLVTGLAAGEYFVSADSATLPTGYTTIPTNLGGDDTYNLTVAANDVMTQLDFGFDGGTTGTIGDRVWLDEDGDGALDAGEPGLAEVTVNLVDSAGNIVATTTTAADGSYLFSGVPDGDYTVAISDIDGVLVGLPQSYDPDEGGVCTTCDRQGSVTVSGGVSTPADVDFGFAPSGGTGTIGDFVWHDANGDGVQDPGESGIQGVTLELWHDVNEDGVITPGLDNLVRNAVTDQNGEYQFSSLPDEDYVVRVTDTAGVVSAFVQTGDPDEAGTCTMCDGQGVLTLAGGSGDFGQDFGYAAPVGMAYTISGTIFDDQNQDGDFDSPGESGVEGALVVLFNDLDGDGVLDPDDPYIGSTVSDADGNYSLTDLPAGDYLVAVDTSGTTVDGYLQTTQTLTAGLQRVEDLSDDLADQDFGFWSGGFITTPVTLAYFRSAGGGNVSFEWATATETGNLGFHLYVIEEEGLRRLNETLVPSQVGDALTPQRYALEASGVEGDLFLLEDVDLYGQTRYHGPFELGRTYGREVWDVKRTDWVGIAREHERKTLARRPRRRSGLGTGSGSVAGSVAGSRSGRVPAVHLRVREDGIYRVTYEALLAAGIDLGGVPATQLALLERGTRIATSVEASGRPGWSVGGKPVLTWVEESDRIGSSIGAKPVPIRVGGSGRFGPGSFVEFVGRGLDTLYTDTNVYTLTAVRQRAVARVDRDASMPSVWAKIPEFYYETRTVETNRAYDFAAPGGDPWYDTRLLAISEPVEAFFDLELEDRLPEVGDVKLTVAMWGVTDFPQTPDHHVVIEVNGVELADEWFDGLEDHPVRVDIPEWVLAPQNNRLRVLLPHDTGALYDLVNYDHYRVRFPRRFAASDGRLHFTAAAAAFRVGGLPSADVVVYRVTKEGIEFIEAVDISGLPGDYSATFSGSQRRATYYVSTVESLWVPRAELAPRRRIDFTGEAEMLIIAHPDFLDGLDPLVAARRSEGLSVQVVNVEEIYQRFSSGVVDPGAIRDFIRRASRKMGTEYVLLVGGDTYDYFDYLGQGAISFVPTLYTRTDPIVHYAPVDPLYGDINRDGVPEVAVGRWPVRTTAELETILQRTLQYADIDYPRTAVFSADAYDVPAGYSFSAASEEMLSYLPGTWQAERAYLDELSLEEARQLLIDEINFGVALTSYFGHSGPAVWSFDGLFDSRDADELENFGRPTVVTQWGCWNNYHVMPSYDTLGHRLLLNDGRGAAAVLGAATLTEALSEQKLGRGLFAQIGSQRRRLGKALIDAKKELAVTDPDRLDVLLGWTLLGDPTLVVEP